MSYKKIFLSILILGILAVTVAGIWYWNSNRYSKGSLKLEIIGPDKVGLAEEVEYSVKYKNNGNSSLEDPKLIFQFPEHSLAEEERKEVQLERIYPGQEKTKKFKARILGTERQAKVAKAWLNYRPKNLKARFESNTTHTSIIEEVPLDLKLNLPSMVEPDSETDFNLSYYSNVNYPLKNLRVNMDYPSGFEFKESKPEGLSKTEWEVGLLNKAEGGSIEIKGKLKGELDEEKIFKGELGMWQDSEFVPLKKVSRGVKLGKPSLYLDQKVNGDSEYVASPGESLHYEITFRNVGDKALSNMFLVSKLKGEGFDYDSLKSTRGSFKEGDNSVVFDSRNVPELQFLNKGAEGKVEFWIDVKEDWDLRNKKPVLTNQVFLSQAQEEFTTKVNSGLELEQVAYNENEVFRNEGPIPPEVGETTEYLIMWKPEVNLGKAKDVEIKAELPGNVDLTDKVFPEEEASNLSYSSLSREVVWDVGTLNGTTTNNNISFQVELTPISSQKGSAATIIEEAEITGVDSFTEEELSATSSAVDTTLSDDGEEGIVQ